MKQVRAKLLLRFCVLAGRVLILLSAVVLAVTPMTAHFWTFDRFLRGGQDFEMGLLSVLVMLCLVLLLAHLLRETISQVIALREWLCDCFRREEKGPSADVSGFRVVVLPIAPPWRCVASFSHPLLI